MERDALVGHWLHAHEEDAEGTMVFRREGTPLPPSRGRISLHLESNGSAQVGNISPEDGIALSPAKWSVEGNHLSVLDDKGETKNWPIVTSEPDRLVLRSPQ